MHVKVIVPLIGLHLNSAGLDFSCVILLMAAATIACWHAMGWVEVKATTACVAIVLAVILAFTAPSGTLGLGSANNEWLTCAFILTLSAAVATVSFIAFALFSPDSDDWGGAGEDNDPDRGGGPSPEGMGIDWGDFDDVRSEWSRARVGTLSA